MHRYTKEEHDFIVQYAPGIGNQELTDIFNEYFSMALSCQQMKSYKANHKISSGLTGYYPKGHIPINKGTKGMFNVGGNKTSFKKGQRPQNTDSIGTEKKLADGYTYVKVSDIPKVPKSENWKKKHYLVWEKYNGPVPKNHVVIFSDGDTENFSIDNLILITRAELLIMNRKNLIKKNQPEVTKVGVTLAKVINKTFEKEDRATALQWEEVHYIVDGQLKCKRGYSCVYQGYKYGIVCTSKDHKRVATVYDWDTGLEVLRETTRLEAHAEISDPKLQKRLEIVRKGKLYQKQVEDFKEKVRIKNEQSV